MTIRSYKLMTFSALFLAVLALAASVWTGVQAQQGLNAAIPATINYQGQVREPNGAPTNGTFTVTARLYSVPSGGTALYTTTQQNITIYDGVLSIVLGASPAFPAGIFDNSDLFIGIQLNDAAELFPRQRVHAVPWALQANTATTLVNNAHVQNLFVDGSLQVYNSQIGDYESVGGSGIAFLQSPVTIYQAKCRMPGTQVFDASPYIPSGAQAVILEATASHASYEGINITINGRSLLVHSIFLTGVNGNFSATNQGIFPVSENRTFSYFATSTLQADSNDCSVTLIGYVR